MWYVVHMTTPTTQEDHTMTTTITYEQLTSKRDATYHQLALLMDFSYGPISNVPSELTYNQLGMLMRSASQQYDRAEAALLAHDMGQHAAARQLADDNAAAWR